MLTEFNTYIGLKRSVSNSEDDKPWRCCGRKTEGAQGVEGARNRLRLEYVSQVMEITGYPSFTALKKLVEDREAWRAAAKQSGDWSRKKIYEKKI